MGENEERLEGVVRTFVSTKGFGYIDGSDGKNYKFYADDFRPTLGETATLDGALVTFDPVPGPKGYRARRPELARPQAIEWVIPKDFIFIKGDEPKRGRVVAFVDDIVEWDSGDPDKVKRRLMSLAQSLGANALLDFRYEKTKGAEGNYEFTVHGFLGTPAVLVEPKMTADLARVEASERMCAEMAETLRRRHEAYVERKRLEEKLYKRKEKITKIISSVIFGSIIAFLTCISFKII
jgi:cold shock CspA family protein